MKAVLVFCEGRHDVAFAQRSLGAHGGCEWVAKRVRELPSPFGPGGTAKKGLIAMRYEKQSLEDLENLTLRDAAHPPLPCFDSVVENPATDTMFVLVRTHGQSQAAPVVNLLEALDATITKEPAGSYDVSEYAAAFLFDANADGVATKLTAFRDRFGAHFGDLTSLAHRAWVATTIVPVGCFVFHRNTQDQTGTIEDHLAPMVESAWPERYGGAQVFVDSHRADADKVSGKDAERLKAIITAAGQFDHPGDPMSVIIGRAGLPRAPFEASPLSRDLADFLAAAPWNRP